MKVRANCDYKFVPSEREKIFGRDAIEVLEENGIYTVINQWGCPPANTMGFCYVAHPVTKLFICMVSTDSLVPLTASERTTVRKAREEDSRLVHKATGTYRVACGREEKNVRFERDMKLVTCPNCKKGH